MSGPSAGRPELLVVGGGPAGVAAARAGARLGARVTLVEPGALGGTCVNAGCIPSGAMHRTAAALEEVRRAGRLGVQVGPATVDWLQMQRWTGSVVASASRLTRASLESAGVVVAPERARFTGAGQLDIGGRAVTAAAVVLAAGASAVVATPPAGGGRRVLTSDDAMALDRAPERLLVAGAARFSIEWADFFCRLGSAVTVAAPEERILPGEDADMAGFLQLLLEQRGIRFLLGPEAAAAEVEAEIALAADARAPTTADLGLAAAGVETDPSGAVIVDLHCRTSAPGVYAAGDVTGPPWLSNRARAQGIVAATNALGGNARLRPERVPRSVNTLPELAAVGLSEAEAVAAGGRVAVGYGELATSLRGLTLGEDQGALKLVVDAEFGEILGAHMVGAGAAEVIAQVATAMELEADYRDLGRVSHVHPTLAELVTDAVASI